MKIYKRQHGAILAVTLMVLFVLALISVTALNYSKVDERMAANLNDKDLSFGAAETALRFGEKWILSLTTLPTIYQTCPTFPCVQETLQNIKVEEQTVSWWNSNSAALGGNGTLKNINTLPRYILEFVRFVPDNPTIGANTQKSAGVYYFQVTARGSGGSDTAISLVQSTVARRF